MITGNRKPVSNPKNLHHTKLTSNLNSVVKENDLTDMTSPSVFKQVPFWKNINDSSIMSNTIYESIKKDNKLIDLDATQVSVEDPLMQNSIFTKRATPFVKGAHFDATGTVRTNEGGSYMQIDSEEVSRIEQFNNTTRDMMVMSVQKGGDPSL
tara:strand:- start:397 stop:855 length:459 start_codon:yes stop_codon:yes gene_type:complete